MTRKMGPRSKEPAYLEDADQDGSDERLDLKNAVTHSIGLHKVQGEAVQAVIGGIFHQFVRTISVLHMAGVHHPGHLS
jgi:hypothetical protein